MKRINFRSSSQNLSSQEKILWLNIGESAKRGNRKKGKWHYMSTHCLKMDGFPTSFAHLLFNHSLSFFPSINRLRSVQWISFFVNEVKSLIQFATDLTDFLRMFAQLFCIKFLKCFDAWIYNGKLFFIILFLAIEIQTLSGISKSRIKIPVIYLFVATVNIWFFTTTEAIYQTNLSTRAVLHNNHKFHVLRLLVVWMKNKRKCLLQKCGMEKALKRVLKKSGR